MSKKIKLKRTDEQTSLLNIISFQNDSAYIKQESINNDLVWSIYNEQGQKLGYASSREVAFAVVTQNEFVGFSVH